MMADVTEGRRLYRADLASLAGLRSPRSLGGVKLPPPDGWDIEAGHARPWWREATARGWLAGRPGKGWRAGLTGYGP